MNRRTFLTGTGAVLLASPLAARAQQPAYGVGQRRKRYRIAVISPAAPIALMTETSPNLFFREFFVELRRLGYVEGENLVVHRFSSEWHERRNPEVATAAIRSAPDVIFAFSSRMVKALKDATTAIPIVGYTADPVSFGIVASLASPGGNVTGISTEAGVEIDGKRLSLIKEIMPTASRLAVLAPVAFWMSPYGSAIRMFAGQLGLFSSGGRSPIRSMKLSFAPFSRRYNGRRQTWFSCRTSRRTTRTSGLSSTSLSAPTCQRSPLRGSS
jgi:putative ABC transport system substrate-binding protein